MHEEINSGITDHFGRLVEIKHPLQVLAELLEPDRQFRTRGYSCAFLFDHETSFTIMRVVDGFRITYSLCLPSAFVDLAENESRLASETFYNFVVLRERV